MSSQIESSVISDTNDKLNDTELPVGTDTPITSQPKFEYVASETPFTYNEAADISDVDVQIREDEKKKEEKKKEEDSCLTECCSDVCGGISDALCLSVYYNACGCHNLGLCCGDCDCCFCCGDCGGCGDCVCGDCVCGDCCCDGCDGCILS